MQLKAFIFQRVLKNICEVLDEIKNKLIKKIYRITN